MGRIQFGPFATCETYFKCIFPVVFVITEIFDQVVIIIIMIIIIHKYWNKFQVLFQKLD